MEMGCYLMREQFGKPTTPMNDSLTARLIIKFTFQFEL